MSTQNIAAPRSPYLSHRKRNRFNIEKWGWIYMRVSGVLLVVLIFGHLFYNLIFPGKVSILDWGFVAGKLSDPFWLYWDLALLWLALIHGSNGMRTLINDYADNRMLRRVLMLGLAAATVVLLVLIFGHLFVNLLTGEGIKALDFAFVGGKWSDPFWQVWDCAMLWLALIHGANGMRTIVNDYAHNRLLSVIFKGGLVAATVVLLILGTLVIFTFDPCPAGQAANLLPSFCAAS
jgi:succinate dehydrogenase / fumarate reductase membrane anchor subunit